MERTEDTGEITARDFEQAFGWLPFDWRWLLWAWVAGFALGVVLVMWVLVFIAGPMV